MYKYGQFVSTPAGRMRIRKKINSPVCKNCFFHVKGTFNLCNLGYTTCVNTIPIDAYLEKPKIRGGKSTTSK